MKLKSTCKRLGHDCLGSSSANCALTIQWGGKRPSHDLPTIYCELGWLPRWSYQVSWSGINANHHAAGQWSALRSDDHPEPRLLDIRAGTEMPQYGWGYGDPTVKTCAGLRKFWLCPLQVPTDVNMESLPEEMQTPQGLVDYVLTSTLPRGHRVYFKQHPASSERGQVLKIPYPHKYLPHDEGQIASYLKSPQCLGVICGNSNVFHDALLWGKPATALGDGFWGKGPVTMEPGTDETNAYLRHVLASQWTLADAGNTEKVRELLKGAVA